MAELTVASITRSGVALPAKVSAASGGDEFVNDGATFLSVANSSGAGKRVVVDAQLNCNQGFDHDVDVTVPNGATNHLIGPFPKSVYNGDGGKADISYPDDETGLTIQAVSVGS